MALSTAFMLSLFYYCTIAIFITKTQAASTPAQASTPTATPAATNPALATTLAGTKPPHLEFTCATDGTIMEIKGVNKSDVVIINGTNYCHLNAAGCNLKNKTKVTVMHVQGEKSPTIAGGKNAHFYQLECKTAGSFMASVNASMKITSQATDVYHKETRTPTEPTTEIKLTITDSQGQQANNVHIGDSLFLKITGPDDYTVVPINCTANSLSSPTTDYDLWKNDNCSSMDQAVMENTWQQDNTSKNKIAVHMYGFRFVDSDTVMVKCTAMFCSKGSPCSSKNCVIGQGKANGRKRRNVDAETKTENGYIEKHISTLFRVVDNRMDTSASSGTFASVFTYVTAFALMLALK